MNSSTATLLIIDMQKGMQNPSVGKRNNPQAETNIAALLELWRKNRAPIVHIRHSSRSVESVFWPGQSGVEFQDDLKPLDSEHVVEKNVPDAFINSGLEKWLRIRNVDELVIVGVSTNISVESTARSAGNLGFRTIVVSDGTYAFDQIDFDGQLRAANVIHAMALGNLNGEFSTVMSTAELLNAS